MYLSIHLQIRQNFEENELFSSNTISTIRIYLSIPVQIRQKLVENELASVLTPSLPLECAYQEL